MGMGNRVVDGDYIQVYTKWSDHIRQLPMATWRYWYVFKLSLNEPYKVRDQS